MKIGHELEKFIWETQAEQSAILNGELVGWVRRLGEFINENVKPPDDALGRAALKFLDDNEL